MDANQKPKRRIVPTLIGPTTSIVGPQPDKSAKIISANILEKQTELLGPALVYKIATGKATEQDINERVEYLNSLGQKWTPESLLSKTAVKTTIKYDPRIQAWLDKWQPIALEEERKPKRKSRNKSNTKYKPKKCLEYSILTSRAYAKRKRIKLGRRLRKKVDICKHILSQLE